MKLEDFDRHCNRHRPDLYNLAFHLTRSKADADDVVQDAYLNAYKNWERFEPQGEGDAYIRGWLFAIVRNNFINRYRRLKRTRAIFAPPLTEGAPEADGPVEGFDPANDALDDDVLTALQTLNPRARHIILRFAAGWSYVEIATELGIPIGSVMSGLHRAREKLRDKLGNFARDYGLTKIDRRSMRNEKAVRKLDHDDSDSGSAEPAESPESESDTVDGIIGGDDGEEFFVGEGDFDSVTAW